MRKSENSGIAGKDHTDRIRPVELVPDPTSDNNNAVSVPIILTMENLAYRVAVTVRQI